MQWYRLLLLAAYGIRRTPCYALSRGMTQQFFIFFVPGELDLSPLTLTFELGRDFCTVHLTAKFQFTFNRSEVIARTNKHSHKLTNKQTECGPMPNVTAALPNIGGALCSTPQSLADAHY